MDSVTSGFVEVKEPISWEWILKELKENNFG